MGVVEGNYDPIVSEGMELLRVSCSITAVSARGYLLGEEISMDSFSTLYELV